MEDRGDVAVRPPWTPAPWMVGALILGAYWTLKGYHSLDGDQAHRLPLLLHQLDPRVFAADPFVRSFDAFNPHRGSLGLVGAVSRLVGLSTALTILFVLTFAASVRGVGRLARASWPEQGRRAGLVAVGLFLIAKAGNIGTNHLFESMLLDRLMGLALAWLAAAAVVEAPRRGSVFSVAAIGLAAVVHPSLGLQLGLIFAGTWLLWALVGRETDVSWRLAIAASAATGLAVVPGLVLNLAPFDSLREGLSPERFWLLTVELQSPQHMLPHLWRTPQWLAAGAYLVLAVPALRGLMDFGDHPFSPCGRRWPERPDEGRAVGTCQTPGYSETPHPPLRGTFSRKGRREFQAGAAPRLRLVLMLGVVLFWLACSWVAVEVFRHVGATVFQPFRMATFARGLALVCGVGHILSLWDRGGWTARLRAAMIPLGLVGDWLFVVVVCVEIASTVAERLGGPAFVRVVFVGSLAYGCLFLSRHDTERGDRPLLALVAVSLIATGVLAWRDRRSSQTAWTWTPRRWRWAMALAWATPLAALAAGMIPGDRTIAASPVVRALVARCRFAAVPIDDVEVLAGWCRENTPPDARFIGPPGPKGFRLWSRRSLAFNRAGSPYHAEGIDDWYRRFADHVDFHGTAAEFVRAYLEGRHRLEARYDAMTDAERASLARRQGADHVVALRPSSGEDQPNGPLELLHAQGKYAVYRVRSAPAVVAHRH